MFGTILWVHCGFRRAPIKTTSVSKQGKLPTGLLGMKRRVGFSFNYSYGGYCEVCNTAKMILIKFSLR